MLDWAEPKAGGQLTGRTLQLTFGLLLALLAALAIAGASQAGPYSGSGDWVIGDSTTQPSGALTVNGNIHVLSGGSLTLNAVTLTVASTYPGQYGILVDAGGSLTVRGGVIAPSSMANTFRFKIFGPALLDGVTVRGTWGSNVTFDFGVGVYDSNVTIINSTIEQGYRGNILIGAGTPRLENNIIRGALHALLSIGARWTCDMEATWDAYGVYITNNSHPTLLNNQIIGNAVPGAWSDPWQAIFAANYNATYCGSYFQIYEMVLVDGVRVFGAGAEMSGDRIESNGGVTTPGYSYYQYQGSYVYVFRGAYDDQSGTMTSSAGLNLVGASGNYTGLTIGSNGHFGIGLEGGTFVVESPTITGHSNSATDAAALGVGSGGTVLNATLSNNYHAVFLYGSGSALIENMEVTSVTTSSAPVIDVSYYASGSLNIFNSSIPSGLPQVVYAGSYNGPTINLYNLTNVTDAGSQIDGYGTSLITIFWELQAQIVWTNDAPVAGAFAIITNQSSGTLYADVLDSTGSTPAIWLPWLIIQCTGNCAGSSVTNSPLTIKAFANGTLSDPYQFVFNRTTFVRYRIADPFPPSLNVFMPVAGQRSNSSTLEVLGNVFDVGSGVDFVEFSADAGATWTTAGGIFPGWTGEQLLPDGTYTLWVRAWDKAGGHTDTNITDLVIDTVPPVFEVLQPSITVGGTLYTNATSVLLRGTAPGDATLTLNGLPLAVSGGQFNRQLILQEGANFYRLSATDPVGNTYEIEFVIVSDTIRPAIYVSSPPELFATNRSIIYVAGVTESDVQLTLNGQPVEVIGGVFQQQYPLSEGLNVLSIEATDRSGNTNLFTRTVMFDTVAPQIVITAPTPGYQTNQRNLEIRGNVEAAIRTVYIDGAPVTTVQGAFVRAVRLDEGLNQFKVQVWDAAGNPASVTVEASLDVTPPTLAIQSPTFGSLVSTNSVRLRGTYEDATAVTVDGVPLALTGDGIIDEQVALLEGTNSIVVHAQDDAGNGVDAEVLVNRDTVAPSLSVNLPSTPLQTRLEAFTITGTVDGAVTLQVNGEYVAFSPTGNFTLVVALKPGVNTFTLHAVDLAGNQVEELHTIQRNLPPSPPEGLFGLGDASYALLPLMAAVGIAATFVIMRRGRPEE